VQNTKTGKIYNSTLKYVGIPNDHKKMPNGGKLDQTAMKYTDVFHCKTLLNLPKLGFLVLEIYHLATFIV
jgi:hypothetical protein